MRVPFQIQRDSVKRYIRWSWPLMMTALFVWVWGLGLLAAVFYMLFCSWWLPRRQAEALRYWVEGGTLFVEEGVYFLKRKAIPLANVTDINMVQGPLMRKFGIWGLRIQTAGQGAGHPEATLLGVHKPELVRNELLAARDEATGRTPAPAA